MTLVSFEAFSRLSHFFSTHPLTRDRPSHAWARFAAWQVRSRLQAEVVFPWVCGQRLAVRRGMTGATGNIYVGLHEFPDMMFLLHFLREDDLFLDIGANIGSYTVLASGVRRAVTWAFEPDPHTAVRLGRNIEINGLGARTRVLQCALGATNGEAPFTIGLDTINRVAERGEANVRLVRQERLDDLIGESQPVMIKIDVEGYEEQVLLGATATLAKASLAAIEIETVTPKIEEMMRDNGFERVFYDVFARRLSAAPGDFHSCNTLFVRDRSVVEARLAAAQKIDIEGRLF
jgi:FkbM family methyltransferase